MSRSVRTPNTATQPVAPVGPVFDTARRISDALLFVLGFPVMGLAWEVYDRRGDSRFLLMVSLGLFVCGALFLSGRVVVRAAIESLEKFSNIDINADGVIGDPDDNVRFIAMNKTPLEQKSKIEQWRAFVTQAKVDQTEDHMLAQGFTRSELICGRDVLIMAGLARWDNPEHRVGWKVTSAVEDILDAIPYYDLTPEVKKQR